ncbi:MAG TPA: DEAD/DEAH box helicase family protein, partial [Gemmatimonadaceae bacterium]|nr:DEAD/DEAH box helicase family protein [Gemmatimonadaceae bacterium]
MATVGDRSEIPHQLGGVTLRPAQRRAAARIVSLMRQHSGAMLAEPVGLGKTYTALAAAKTVAANESILIALPAALRQMWTDATRACDLWATIVTHEALSRGGVSLDAA